MLEHHWQKYKDKSVVLFNKGASLDRFVERKSSLSEEFYQSHWVSIDDAYKKLKEGSIPFNFVFTQSLDHFDSIRKDFPLKSIIVSDFLKDNSETIWFKNEEKDVVHYSLQNLREDGLDIDKFSKVYSKLGIIFSALHVLCYMGFSKIYIVGVDYNNRKKKVNFKQFFTDFCSNLERKYNIKVVNLSSFL